MIAPASHPDLPRSRTATLVLAALGAVLVLVALLTFTGALDPADDRPSGPSVETIRCAGARTASSLGISDADHVAAGGALAADVC